MVKLFLLSPLCVRVWKDVFGITGQLLLPHNQDTTTRCIEGWICVVAFTACANMGISEGWRSAFLLLSLFFSAWTTGVTVGPHAARRPQATIWTGLLQVHSIKASTFREREISLALLPYYCPIHHFDITPLTVVSVQLPRMTQPQSCYKPGYLEAEVTLSTLPETPRLCGSHAVCVLSVSRGVLAFRGVIFGLTGHTWQQRPSVMTVGNWLSGSLCDTCD